jgi:hypothetical protein
MKAREELLKLVCQQSALNIKIDDYLKALEIIVKKNASVWIIKKFGFRDVRDYNKLPVIDVEERLTQEEYDLVSKVVKEIMEDE